MLLLSLLFVPYKPGFVNISSLKSRSSPSKVVDKGRPVCSSFDSKCDGCWYYVEFPVYLDFSFSGIIRILCSLFAMFILFLSITVLQY